MEVIKIMSNIAGNPFYIASIIFLVLSLGTLLTAVIVFFKFNVLNAIRIVSNKVYVSNSVEIDKANKKSNKAVSKVRDVTDKPNIGQTAAPKTEQKNVNVQAKANETVMLNRNQVYDDFRIIKNLIYVNTSEVIK